MDIFRESITMTATGQNRELYNQDFLDANCNPDAVPFNEQNGVDSSVATFSTNYIVSAIAIFFALHMRKTFYQSPPQQQDDHNDDKEHVEVAVSVYFICTGLSFGIAGLGHQFSKEQEEVLNQYLLRIVAFFGNVANFALLRVMILYRQPLSESSKLLWTWRIVFVTALVWGTVVAVNNVFFVAVPGLIAVLSGLVLHAWQWKRSRTLALGMKTCGFVCYLMGGVAQIILAPVCGYDAYPDCFVDCPLPAPNFNHNALFHVFAIFYFLLYGMGEWLQPAQKCLALLRQQERASADRIRDGDVSLPELDGSSSSKVS
mmetsp:Transcript_16984/g.32235  ORF Transcript_16984/g.32235 Transcript_16984/m.32235 type:complete len:316 (-) Transcript_16984:29-976(-)